MSKNKTSHKDHVARMEAILRESGRPYVAVDDARKAIFSGAKIDNFDLLIYMPEGNHLLATVLPPSRHSPTEKQQSELRQWVKVFGAGFDGAFIHAADPPTAWPLDEHPRRPRLLRSVLAVGWAKAEEPKSERPPNGGCQDAGRCPHAAPCDAQPPGPDALCLKVMAEREQQSDDLRRAASLGYLFPGAEPTRPASLEPMLF